MYKVLNYGVCLGIVASLVGCGTSEHFMQDDVYNTRTPIMPPGTDLNDVTDYATFVAKKEQTEAPAERTAYVSPRQYNDYFYNSQYLFYGYSPYSSLTGLGYYGYGGYYNPHGYCFGNNLYPSIGFGSYYNYGYNPYGYYGNPYYGGGYGQWYGNTSWHTPANKPNTVSNLSSSHAGTSAGRMGSSTNGIVSYPNQLIAKPNKGYSGVGRNSTVNSSPVVNNSGGGRNVNLNGRQSVRPVTTGKSSAPSTRSGSYQRTNERTINSGTNNRSNNTNNNSGTRTSSPTIRSGGSSGGSVSSPGTGGSRSGGRR